MGSYRVAIWDGVPEGRLREDLITGLLLYVEDGRWCQVAWTPPCDTDEDVIREAKSAADIDSVHGKRDESGWREGPLNSYGPFYAGDRQLAEPRRIVELSR